MVIKGGVMNISNIMKVLADDNRLRILSIIKNNYLCVGEIQTILNITQSNASKHLEKLKASGIIESNKEAQWIYYKLADDKLKDYPFLFELIYNNLSDEDVIKEDLIKLGKYKASGLCCQDLRAAEFKFSDLGIE